MTIIVRDTPSPWDIVIPATAGILGALIGGGVTDVFLLKSETKRQTLATTQERERQSAYVNGIARVPSGSVRARFHPSGKLALARVVVARRSGLRTQRSGGGSKTLGNGS